MGRKPHEFNGFVGQFGEVRRLKTQLEGARTLSDRRFHIAIFGPSGTGKTVLARAIAREADAEFVQFHGRPSLKQVTAKLQAVEKRCVLFFDEAHSLSADCQEFLFTVLDDDFSPEPAENADDSTRSGEGDEADGQHGHRDRPWVTVIIATDKPGKLLGPFSKRFGLVVYLDYYSDREMRVIVRHLAREVVNVDVSPQGRTLIVQASCGEPRLARQMLESLRRANADKLERQITRDEVARHLAVEGYDHLGLTSHHHSYLEHLYHQGDCGLQTIRGRLQIDEVQIRDRIEPLLLRHGLITIERSGRHLTERGAQHVREVVRPMASRADTRRAPSDNPLHAEVALLNARAGTSSPVGICPSGDIPKLVRESSVAADVEPALLGASA